MTVGVTRKMRTSAGVGMARGRLSYQASDSSRVILSRGARKKLSSKQGRDISVLCLPQDSLSAPPVFWCWCQPLGEIAAVSLETTVILTISWFVSRWIAKTFNVPGEVSPRLLTGTVAFVLSMQAEAGVSVFVFDRPVQDHLAAYLSAPGAIRLAAQIAFAVIPVMQRTQP
jgi:hypothetical protein